MLSNVPRGAALVAHGGGPTIVLNSSLAGVIEECSRNPRISAIYGSENGLEGLLSQRFFDLSALQGARLDALGAAPASALGSSRRPLSDDDIEEALRILRARDVQFFFYNGGNGSMDTALRFERMARARNYDLAVIGIPKTIDNDLTETDHSPGYGSTARFFACALRDIGADNRSLPTPVSIVEVLGRNAGWLAAATCFARNEPDDAPHLIYFPERPLPVAKLLSDIETVHRRLGRVVVAICEGQLDDTGNPFGADVRPASRHKLAMNLGHVLAMTVMRELNITARSEKPGLLGRASSAFVSTVDRAEARECGRAAVRAALAGETGKMVGLVREPGPEYRVTTSLVDLSRVAAMERPFPVEWMHPEGNDVLPAFRDYAAPLIGDIAPHQRLSGNVL